MMIIGRRRNKNKQGVYAFIDSQNLNIGTQKAGFKLDWKKFYQYLKEQHGVTRAFLFVGYIQEYEDMYRQLHEFGYAVVLKPTHDLTRPPDEKDDKKPIKGNIDAELVLWAMREFNNYQKAIVVSGDGDFYCLVEYLEQQGKLGKVLVPNRHFSSMYNRYKDYVVRLDEQRGNLSYRDHKPRKR